LSRERWKRKYIGRLRRSCPGTNAGQYFEQVRRSSAQDRQFRVGEAQARIPRGALAKARHGGVRVERAPAWWRSDGRRGCEWLQMRLALGDSARVSIRREASAIVRGKAAGMVAGIMRDIAEFG
jgi:hypothetical protein